MPPVDVYSVNFAHGNLVPSLDVYGWGKPTWGSANPGNAMNYWGDKYGLHLTIVRQPTDPKLASYSLYVLPDPQTLQVESRLRLKVEFDRPSAGYFVGSRSVVVGPPGTFPEPWAVGLSVKLGNENDVDKEPQVPVTCQFSRDANGVRLNTPGSEQGDESSPLEGPLDYSQYNPPSWTDFLDYIPPLFPGGPQLPCGPKRFVLEHTYAGFKIDSIGHTAGSGALSIGGSFASKKDRRVFSHTGLFIQNPANKQDWIGALGLSLVTRTGVGQLHVRLRSFSIALWA